MPTSGSASNVPNKGVMVCSLFLKGILIKIRGIAAEWMFTQITVSDGFISKAKATL